MIMTLLTPYQQAALDFTKHISLTANAGSGKTFVLSKRFVEIALLDDVKLSGIVAITFTEKAAGELNKKIANEIESRFETAEDETVKRKLGKLRRLLISANISTIHSFCINLLKEYSAEAGIDANFTPLSQQDADELIELSLEDSINKALRGNEFNEEVRSLIRLLGSKNILVNEIKKLIGKRKALESISMNLYSQPVEDIAEFYKLTSESLIEKLFDYEIKEIIPKINEINNYVLEADGQNERAVEIKELLGKVQTQSIIESLYTFSHMREKLLTGGGTVAKRGYLSKAGEIPGSIVADVESFFKEIKPFENMESESNANLVLAEYSKSFIAVFNYVLSNYEERKRKRGFLDFEDILLFAQKLTTIDSVKKSLRRQYKYIMIDEYQDTNEIQYNIFMPILDNLNEGNLFVVGDEKQSIYMFRDAELEIFNKTKEEISTSDKSGLLLLPHSFRVAPQIAQFTNALFENLFANPNYLLNEVKYDELLCSRSPEDEGAIEFLINKEESCSEAELTAKKVIKLIKEKKLCFYDIAILCRKRSSFAELEKAFNHYKIPYLIGGGTGFYQRQIIYDIYNYISFLINNKDDTALVGILRSPFFTLPDDVIFRVSKTTGTYFYEKLMNYSNDKNDEKLSEIIFLLKKHFKLAFSVSIPELVRTILIDTSYWSVVSHKINSRQELSNLYKLIGLARSYSTQSFKTLYDFKIFLKESIAYIEDEGQAQITGSANAVNIMTFHQSKGLEYKAVFLYKSNEKIREERAKSKSVAVDKNWGLMTKVPLNNDYFADYASAPIVEVYNYIQNKKLIAEAKRLFYVGITRAMDYLFITGDISNGKINSNTLLQFIADGLSIDYEKDEFTLSSKLKFMLSAEENFKVVEKNLTTGIPLISRIEEIEFVQDETTGENFEQLLVDDINYTEKNEIVSATKIAVFSQCPTKYYLTYELGYSQLYKVLKTFQTNYEFRYEEDEDTLIYADLRGRIIHKILEKEITETDLPGIVFKYLNEKNETHLMHDEQIKDLEKSIVEEVLLFFQSDVYKEISSFENYYNEYEIYTKKNDYYLYGIIDKLIVNNDEAIIIDYKTDFVHKEALREKANHYLPQLKFYSYMISLKYPSLKKITARLVFIKKPGEKIEFNFTEDELTEFGFYIDSTVKEIRVKNFDKNLSHCLNCHFFYNNNCVKHF